jgi:hypothetical protein
VVLFHQALDDLASLEQRFPFLFVELGDGLRHVRFASLALLRTAGLWRSA